MLSDSELNQSLRQDGEWRAKEILAQFSAPQNESEILPRLLVACGVCCGPARLETLRERLATTARLLQPRMTALVETKGLQAFAVDVDKMAKALTDLFTTLHSLRARIRNEGGANVALGLRFRDLETLVSACRWVMLTQEVTQRPNPAGIRFAQKMLQTPPDLNFAHLWQQRLLGSLESAGVFLYVPPELGRVVVVFRDGWLAYDPELSPP